MSTFVSLNRLAIDSPSIFFGSNEPKLKAQVEVWVKKTCMTEVMQVFNSIAKGFTYPCLQVC